MAVSSNKPLLVIRTVVPARLEYVDYRQELRYDFFYSCAYCQIAECESETIGFEIDHFIPRNADPDLVAEYSNLMYACKICNGRKSDLYPPREAQQQGHRFFKIDQDIFDDHFNFNKLDTSKTILKYSISGISPIGNWTVDALDLNREILLRLRKIRDDLSRTDEFVQKGITGLRNYSIDQLPPQFRARAQAMIYRVDAAAQAITSDIDELLRRNAKSDFADPDPNALVRANERRRKMGAIMVQYPGSWRAPRKQR